MTGVDMSSRVGTGHVAIFPVMSGFKKSVSKEMKSAGSSGARDLENGLKGAGTKSGKRLGSELKSAFGGASQGLGGDGLKVLQREVATASQVLSRARLKQQDEAGKVRVAEVKLSEAVAKHGESSSQAVAAEERLEAARRRHAAANDTVKAATERLQAAQKNLADVTADSGTAADGAKGKFLSFLDSVKGKVAEVGSSVKQHLVDGLTKAADLLRGPATAAVGAFATVSGIALGKGFSRLKSLDEATAKMRGLGHDGKTVGTIMQNSLAAVKGTAFGLGEAATVAAGAVAAQIKPGQELEQHLKRVSNNAAAAGVSMEDMGAIFNKAATQANGVQNDVIGQLADKGIPIYEELGKILGVTSGEVFKLASQGKIDFETFSRAAEAAAGTVAEEMGKTVPGALKNFWASVGRIGANILGGVDEATGEMYGLYAKIGPLIAAVTTALGPVEDWAKRFGGFLADRFGPILDRVTEWIARLGDAGSGMSEKFSGVMAALAPLTGVFLALGSGGLAGVISRIPILGGMLGPLGGIFRVLGGPIGLVLGLLGGLVAVDASKFADGMTTMIPAIVSGFQSLIPHLVGVITELVPTLVTTLAENIPLLLRGAVELFTALVDAVVEVLPSVLDALVEVLPVLVEALLGMIPSLLDAGIELLMALVYAVIEIVPPLIEALVELLPELIAALLGMLPKLLEAAVKLFTALAEALPVVLPMLIDTLVGLLPVLTDTLVGLIPVLLEAAIELFTALVDALPEILPALLTAIATLAPLIVTSIIAMLPQLLSAGKRLFTGLVTSVGDVLPSLLGKLGDLKNRIFGFFANAGSWLLNAGRSIISGLTNGIVGAFQGAVNAVRNGLQRVRNLLPFSPAKEGPFSGRGWTLYSGQALMEGLAQGITDQRAVVADSMRAALEQAQNVAVSAGRIAVGVSGAVAGEPGGEVAHAGVVYHDNSTIINPVAEPSSTTKRRKLQKAAAGTEALE